MLQSKPEVDEPLVFWCDKYYDTVEKKLGPLLAMPLCDFERRSEVTEDPARNAGSDGAGPSGCGAGAAAATGAPPALADASPAADARKAPSRVSAKDVQGEVHVLRGQLQETNAKLADMQATLQRFEAMLSPRNGAA